MRVDDIREGFNAVFESMAEGWRHLRESASSTITRFKPSESTGLPARGNIDDTFYMPSLGWAMLGGDVFEDESRVVVRLEVPGMTKEELRVDVDGGALVVSGEKRFEHEAGEGRWRVMQRAYGSFRRAVPLPAQVRVNDAKASYVNGVLRVELPKQAPSAVSGTTIRVD